VSLYNLVSEPFDFVLIGGTGDLACGKLLPALYLRDFFGQLASTTRIIGVATAKHDSLSYRNLTREAIKAKVKLKDLKEDILAKFLQRLFYVRVGNEEIGFASLKELLDERPDYLRMFYLAIPPTSFADLCHKISTYELATSTSRIILEKPIGLDRESAKHINAIVESAFSEDRIYRVDHYLCKETVQNLVVLRFANVLFEPVWNSRYIDHVQITVAEKIGILGRKNYYDLVGALRDMVQNHILQLLCLVAMEPPCTLTSDRIRDEKLAVLRSLKPILPKEVCTFTVRGQYDRGVCRCEPVLSYREEVGNSDSQTETFVALKVEVNNCRWAGVPFYLRTGKRMPSTSSDIVVTFKEPPKHIFNNQQNIIDKPNRLVIKLRPDDGAKLLLTTKNPESSKGDFQFVSFGASLSANYNAEALGAYEKLIAYLISGNQTFFMRHDEIESAWRWIDTIIEGWKVTPSSLRFYRSGTWGPMEAVDFIKKDGRMWYEEPFYTDNANEDQS